MWLISSFQRTTLTGPVPFYPAVFFHLAFVDWSWVAKVATRHPSWAELPFVVAVAFPYCWMDEHSAAVVVDPCWVGLPSVVAVAFPYCWMD
jgi:hypothetical protein